MNPSVKTVHDNRTQAGTQLQDGIFRPTGGFGIPCAGIDRMPSGGVLFYGRGAGAAQLPHARNIATKANVTITSSYVASSRLVIVRVM